MTSSYLHLGLTCATAALLPFSAIAGGKKSAPPIGVQTDESAQNLQWGISKDWHSATLKLSNENIEAFSLDFLSGQPVTLAILAEGDIKLPDGLYNWELKVNTSPLVTRTTDLTSIPATDQDLHASGVISIVNGKFLIPKSSNIDSDQPSQLKDQVILDDLIVDGSIAVGQDSVNGENFGFDTIRLKENNLRIKFQDTSTSASFPSNDWQITINDSSNGGANKFSIDDIDGGRTPFTIEAASPSHSLYVDNGGRIGFNTSTPVTELHAVNGDTTALRLEQNGSSGFTPQTWDIAGNETNFFVRDATNGSALPFRIRPGAPQNALYISGFASGSSPRGAVGIGTASPSAQLDVVGNLEVNGDIDLTGNLKFSGDVGIGTETPSAKLDLVGNLEVNGKIATQGSDGLTGISVIESSTTAADRNLLELKNNGITTMSMENTNASTKWLVKVTSDGSMQWLKGSFPLPYLKLDTSGSLHSFAAMNAPGFNTVSDINKKNSIVPVNPQEVLNKVLKTPISEWSYNSESTAVRHIGPMAQDFKAQFQLGTSDKTINLSDSSGVALAAIQGLNQVITEKDAEIEELKAKSDRMQEQLDHLIKEVQSIKSKN